MKLSNFDYILPQNLIAQTPIEPRDHSRLLILNPKTEEITEGKFFQIADYLTENDVLVLNETKVINARLRGKMDIFPKGVKKVKEIEILLHKQISLDTWEVLGPGNNLKVGKIIRFDSKTPLNPPLVRGEIDQTPPVLTDIPLIGGGQDSSPPRVRGEARNEQGGVLEGTITQISQMGRLIKFNKSGFELLKAIEELGEIPLPPYITEDLKDKERYQTIFAKTPGSAASPTASLHFTKELLENLEKKGVKIEKVLLHIGVGTFKPVETENIEEHYMHNEYIEISKETANKLNIYKSQGKRIIAVGTTAVRVLESFAEYNKCHSILDTVSFNCQYTLTYGSQETNIFIYPGYSWKFVDSIITNFHLPKSTLLMLVSSFAGTEFIKKAYKYAIKNQFRFFSFGDVMWIKERK